MCLFSLASLFNWLRLDYLHKHITVMMIFLLDRMYESEARVLQALRVIIAVLL